MSQYFCKNERRREDVRDHLTLNGIDFVEVVDHGAATQRDRQRFLKVHCLKTAPALAPINVRIEGGVRIKSVEVVKVTRAGKVLTVEVKQPGDFSIYTLHLVASSATTAPPTGFDPQLSAIEFSFKVECPSEFDCKLVEECPPLQRKEPEIDYQAKDYASFRRLMLDRLSVTMPEWRDRNNPADVQVALVELLAYVGDHLSYYQDAIATEAYLGTARQRVSVRRHARLLDYVMHDGCNARTWVCLEVDEGKEADGKTLPGPKPQEGQAGTRFLTKLGSGETTVDKEEPELELAIERGVLVFESMHDVTLRAAHNEIHFYTWGDGDCCLPRGSTQATLLDERQELQLEPGDVLIFEEMLSPTTGLPDDADPEHRQAVRLAKVERAIDPLDDTKVVNIEWHHEDALKFPLCLRGFEEDTNGSTTIRPVSVAWGNVVLADQGLTLTKRFLVPEMVPARGGYQPRLKHRDLTFAGPYDHEAAQLKAAAITLVQDPRQALPAVRLSGEDELWIARRDLLGSDRFATEFVVETEEAGEALLRFGDGKLGRKPSPDTEFETGYRLGNGGRDNVGAKTIRHVVSKLGGIRRVWNPLPASGGTNPETVEEVKQFSPQAFRRQERAVTEEDYAEVAQRHPEVQKAVATFRWTGSWHTVFVTVDRKGGLPVKEQDEFQREMRTHLERYRLAGYDLEIDDPVPVPLEISFLVCVRPGYVRSEVKQHLLQVFGRDDLGGGRRGVFHPDNFTFGQPLYVSQLYQTAMEVPGVASVELTRFVRRGEYDPGPSRPATMDNVNRGYIGAGRLEIIRLDNDPNFPENGKIDFDMHGGL